MKLNEILAISGHSGLYKLVAQGKNNIIVESLIDGNRIPAFSTDKVSALSDIALFTTAEELSLSDVFKKMFEAFEKKEINLNFKKQTKEMLAFFEKAIPEYDKNRVYTSDIKKLMTWYNILVKNNLITLEEETTEETTEETKLSEAEKSVAKDTPVAKEEKAVAGKTPVAKKAKPVKETPDSKEEAKPKKTTAKKKPSAPVKK
jgi:hypothetical protein